MKSKILIFLSYYLPGYKSGGPVRTVENLINSLHSYFDFYIITTDRDLGDSAPYQNITTQQWTQVGNAKVFYIDRSQKKASFYKTFLNKHSFDLIYFNSFFNLDFTIKPLLALKRIKNPPPFLLAPRGEFSQGALQLKYLKKHLFLSIGKWIYKGAMFHASSKYEKQDILQALPHIKKENIYIALNIPQKHGFIPASPERTDSTLKLVFISRINPKKNLDYALKVLQKVNVKAIYDIYGPIEDEAYWKECQKLIQTLPDNIKCNYKGTVTPNNILKTFAKYDLFFFPTKGENYGHVIAESLAAGTPVLISDQTPWRNLRKLEIGWDLNLENMESFREKLTLLGEKPQCKISKIKIVENAQPLLINKADIKANKNMFMNTMQRNCN